MAKIKTNNVLNTIVSVLSGAKDAGALHLYAEGTSFNGRHIKVSGHQMYHFGTTGYLGLEQDQRLKEAAIAAIQNYGTQFPLSKSYISHPLYYELESLMRSIYDNNYIIITKNSTLGHIAVIPSIMDDGDGVLLDHQVHWSVQNAVAPLKLRSIPVEMVRHNDLNMLEDKIKKLQTSRNKIWYMADGVYSMYGDYAPIKELMELSKKYPKLYFYFDDVHGMSWKGDHGNGFVMSKLKNLPDKVVIFGTLSKTFGASGSVMVCKDKNLFSRIKNYGGPLSFSAQLEPASVGAAIASAKIHLSPEIVDLQQQLQKRVIFFNDLLEGTKLPLITQNDSPVFFIGAGSPETGYNLVQRLMNDGFYTNLGIFPAVPIKNTGLRITISLHNKEKDIEKLVRSLNFHYPKSLNETHTDLGRVHFAFGMTSKSFKTEKSKHLHYNIEHSINAIDPELWNTHMADRGMLDWKGLKFLEESFSGNDKPEHNFQFYYIIIRDREFHPILISFFTYGLLKEDMLASAPVSLKIEKQREKDPYYFTSSSMSMGSIFSEASHLYLDREHLLWQDAFHLMLKKIEDLERKLRPDSIIMRDFDPSDRELEQLFHHKGYMKVSMPEGAFYNHFTWDTKESYFQSLSQRSRRHFRNDILPKEQHVVIEVTHQLKERELKHCFQLYLNVKRNNPGLNTFDYPIKLFKNMNNSRDWRFILVKKVKVPNQIIGVMFCYFNHNSIFVPGLVGLDYDFNEKFGIYRQLLYHSILEAKKLGAKRIDFGITAGFEKRKLGAHLYQNCAYIQTSDNFNLESLEWLRQE
ncbi:7-keto-8-aminopelargonate synthetase [Zunongwangia mangrovi]|uniref:7-keto-8-aminopelargonate synthetase n=1 Tax=Zunongwangia mangrovi TaxID=1334022 RepID=A0A1I1ML53_9FLAO|nr:aminotransferase class I/II-fold pyridoxal phosphate-dependent enzyme [Zunongwangia mangrovi]SFC85865.1 7-keto-8-aminopelargonate synthetase [Zunongwangia mangrovi]